MYLSCRRQAILRVCALLFAIFSADALVAQDPKVLAPHQPVEPRVEHPRRSPFPATLRSMVGGFWMTDANWKSSIYLTNDVASDALTVTPILYLSNGRKLTLPEVKLEASGTAVISINDALQQQNIAPWATLSGYVEVQYRWPWDALCVTVRNLDSAHSLIHTYYLQSTGVPPKGARSLQAALENNILEGLWWKQESGVTGFIALSNTLAQPVHAIVQVSDAAADQVAEHSVTISPHGTKVVNLRELASIAGSQGGVRVTWEAPEGGLIVNGGLEDQATGYSARLPLHFPPVAAAETAQLRYAAVGLMSGAADPMMSFPAGTTFTPYAVVRNISAQPLSVTPTLWWMEGSMPHSAKLQQLSLPPYNSRNLNLPELISKAGVKNFNGNLNLILDADGKSRALLTAIGSVDQRNTYVFEVLSSGIIESVAKSLSYWSTRDGDDTMVTLWNPADEAQDFVFTLFFPGGHYRLPIHLEARATRAFNVSEIIHNQIPDDQGNIIPAAAREGSAQIAGSHGENEHILISVDAGTYNVQKATCGTYCFTCQGAVNAWITDDPFGLGVNDTHQLTMTVQYHNGATYDHTSVATWTSSDTTLATVNAGLVSGVSAGAVSMDGFSPNVPDFAQGCLGYNPDGFCPQSTGIDAGSPGTVATFTGVLTANDNFSGRSTTTFGIAEVINLSFSTNPSGTAASTFGGLQWTLVSGGGTLSNAGTAGTATYTAPSSQATVVLRLADGQGNGSNYAITVIPPSGGHVVKNSNLRHTNGVAGVGFLGDIYLEPSNVSFAGITFGEGTVNAVASGFYASLNGTAHAADTFSSVGGCSSTTGCKVSPQDTIDSGDKGPPFSVGDFLWAIPWQYFVGSGSRTTFATANHHQYTDATGTASIEKKGAGPFSKNASDPTSSY